MERDEVFDELRRRGAARAIVPFYGGGDEGVVEGVELFDLEGSTIAALEEHDPVPVSNQQPHSEDQTLAEALEDPVWERFTFEGDIEVRGQAVWDVATRSIAITGSQTSWEEFD